MLKKGPLKAFNDIKLINQGGHLDAFKMLQNLKRSLVPKTSNCLVLFLNTQYSKMALVLWEGRPGPPGPLRLIVLYFCDNTRHLPCAFCSYFPVVSNVCVSSSPTYTTYFKVLCRAAAATVAPPSHTILEADSLPRVRTIPICSLLLLLPPRRRRRNCSGAI